MDKLINIEPATNINDHPQVLQDITELFVEEFNSAVTSEDVKGYIPNRVSTLPSVVSNKNKFIFKRTCPRMCDDVRVKMKKEIRDVWIIPDRSKGRGYDKGNNKRIDALKNMRSRVLLDKVYFKGVSRMFPQVIGLEKYDRCIDDYVRRIDKFLIFEEKVQYMWDHKDMEVNGNDKEI